MGDFRLKAIAANDGTLHDDDICLVEQVLEIEAALRDFEIKLARIMHKHRDDPRYLKRCRDARQEKANEAAQRKRDLLLVWFPGLKRLELSRH